MKKNLSSKAIKAMAIGLSIAMGVGTGVSGVMGEYTYCKSSCYNNKSE